MEQPVLSFIVLTMNRKDKLQRCLHSIAAQQEADMEIIVLDNASSDGSAEMVRTAFPQVKMVAMQENLGVASGRNHAAAQATGAVLVFVDDDAYFRDKHGAQQLAHSFSAADAPQAVMMTVTEPDGSVFSNYIPREDKKLQPEDTPCACMTGGACAITRASFEALGGFWPLLSPYGYEDRDFMFRFLQAGHRAIWSRSIELVHDKDEDPNLNPKWVEYVLPHHSWVALRHLPVRYVLSYMLHGWPYFAYKSCKAGHAMGVVKSIGRFFRHLSQVLRLRQPVSREVIDYCKAHSGRLHY